MSTIKEKIQALKPNQRFISFEFFPPKTDSGFRNLLARLNRMSAMNPLFITVTWGAGGSTSEKSLDLAATCQNDLGLTTVLHLTCTNTNKEIIDDALKKAKENGIRNILALRGDPPRAEEYWTPNCDFNSAVDLVRYIKEQYNDYFCIGVAGYPEGHVDGSDSLGQNPQKDIPYLVEKVEAGADFIITQLFYDVDKFISYNKLLKSVPELKDTTLIPGLMPITTYKVFTRASKLSHASIPKAISSKLEASIGNDDAIKGIGVDIMTDIIERITAETDIKGFHFYSLNLEKAVASVINRSHILQTYLENSPSIESEMNDDAIASSDEEDKRIIPKLSKRRKSSILNENGLSESSLALSAQRSLVGKALMSDKKVLVDISTGKGALGKDATWDDFPNGRFGDSNSPAYGEIDGYGPTLKVNSPEEAIKKWGTPETIKDITNIFIEYLSGKIDVLPWTDSPLSAETALIQEELFELNFKGWFSLASQPATNGCKSTDRIFGWGPKNGIVYQKGFVEIFVPKDQWEKELYPQLKAKFDEKLITYYAGDAKGNITSNLSVGPNSHNSKNAITWGVFPSKEVLQPTIIDFESFKAWNEEAFLLWVEWARCYKKNTKSFELLNSIYNNYVLVSLIHHDFNDESALWRELLGE
ncbi:methylenetetrahydrofolate reductase-domain-containing protein [Scheffersomyces xylosifermentans]|uniref:methylenetetrahydrofolate reductase-domain-containing protein n=1 Tax=Scheffersomyces xylosifermentans TaxID=1304137 RepID=UPI00315C8A64